MLQTLRTYWTTAALGLLIVYFGVHALTGERGILSTGERDQALVDRQAELAALSSIYSGDNSESIVIANNASRNVIALPALSTVSDNISVANNVNLCADIMDDVVDGLSGYRGNYSQINSLGSCN